MEAVRMWARYTAASIRAQMQYPGSLALMSFGQFLATIVDFVGLTALFTRFGHIGGWSFGDVCIFYATISIAFAIADTITRGFDVFGTEFVKTGAFDRLLLRPRTTAFQLLGHEFRLTRIGRFIQAVLVMAIGLAASRQALSPAAVALLAWAIAGGAALFSGILVLQATLAFWTVESLEVANILTYGGVTAGSYPISVYARWFRSVLTYVVPIACVAYFPVVAALGRHDPLGAPDAILPLTPALGFAFLAVSLWIWGFGVRRYTSTGS